MKGKTYKMNNYQGLNEFSMVLNILIEDRDFRHRFFDDPRKALQELPISYSEQDIEEFVQMVRQISKKLKEKDAHLDEQLLLCCSIGY